MTIPCAGTFLLIFNNSLWESADLTPTSNASWTQEPFPAGGPSGVIALGTGQAGQWVLDSTFPTAPLWRRVDRNTFVPLNITSDLSPFFLDFYTTPFFFPPNSRGMNILGDIGVPSGQTQQMYVQSTDGGQTAQTFTFGNLPFPAGSTLVRFWANERGGPGPGPPFPGFFMAQVRQQSPTTRPDFLYGGLAPFSWSQTPLLQTGPLVNQMFGDFIRKQNGTFLVGALRAPDGQPAILRSTNGGANWTPASLPSFALSQGLVECDNGTVLVPLGGNVSPGTPGVVLRSTDDGQSFQFTLPVPGANVVDVWLKYFPLLDMLFAYVQQDTGSAPFGTAVYLSTDQGQSWTQVFTSALSVSLSRRQVTSWMALTGGTLTGQQMPNGCTIATILSPAIPPTMPSPLGTASLPPLSKFFFYSNNPEPVTDPGGLADNGFCLLKEPVPNGPVVSGSGRVYYWHQNATGVNINSKLLVLNQNSFQITVNATYGLANSSANPPTSGVDAWSAFFSGQTTSFTMITIATGGTGDLFVQSGLPPNTIYGVVADLNIINSSTRNPASAMLFDVAWKSTLPTDPTTLVQAAVDGSTPPRVRGLGLTATGGTGQPGGSWIPVNLNTFTVSSALVPPAGTGQPQGFRIASATPGFPIDSFDGADVPFVADPSDPTGINASHLLGNYGAQLCFTWPIRNDDTMNSHRITIYAGSSNNFASRGTNFAVNYQGFGGCNQSQFTPQPPPGIQELQQNHYVAIIQDTLAPNTTVTYRFQIVTIGAYTYPLTLLLVAT